MSTPPPTNSSIYGRRMEHAMHRALTERRTPVGVAPEMPRIDGATLALPARHYYSGKYSKTKIVLHHTVGGTARSTFDWWTRRKGGAGSLATAFIIGRDGRIYQLFDPKCWAWHCGTGGSRIERHSIGIELASEGPLTLADDGRLYAFERVTPKTLHSDPQAEPGQSFDAGPDGFRGHRYFDQYSFAQIASCTALVDWLCHACGVPRRTPSDHFGYQKQNLLFEGVIGHHQIRADKSDVHPGFLWDMLVGKCGLDLA